MRVAYVGVNAKAFVFVPMSKGNAFGDGLLARGERRRV